MEMDDTTVSVGLPTERPMYRRPTVTAIDSAQVQEGSADFDSSALVSQMFIDRDDLLRRVWDTLGPRDQVGLREVVAGAPLEQGLAELVGLPLADRAGPGGGFR